MSRTTWQLMDVSAEGFASLLDPETGETRDDLKFPPEAALEDPPELAAYNGLITQMREGTKDVMVVVLSALGTEMILSQAASKE